LKTGRVNFGVGDMAYTGQLSDRGAMLRALESPWGMTDRLDLAIASEHLRRPCRVVYVSTIGLNIANSVFQVDGIDFDRL
jgi:hypothetical protein